MGVKNSAIDSQTTKHLHFDAGVLVRNYTIGGALAAADKIGATSGGCNVEITLDINTPKIDGAVAAVVGTERLIASDCKISGTFAEVDRDLVTDLMPGSTFVAEGVTHNKVTFGQIGAADYLANVALIVTHSNDTSFPAGTVFLLKNARGEGTLKMDTKDGEMNTLEGTFVACVLPAAPADVPCEVYVPIVSGDPS